MSRPPVIGILAPQVRARWGPWDGQALVVPAGYVRAVQDAGGLAFAVGPGAPGGPEAVLDVVAGVTAADA